MKSSILVLAVFWTAMAFVSCNQDDANLGSGDDQSLKSVTISLANVEAQLNSRADGGAEIRDGEAVTLANFQVFFTDGEKLYQGKTTAGTSAEHFYSNTSGLQATTFHFLPAAVNKVVVIGNLRGDDGNLRTAEISVTDGVTSLSDIDQELNIDKEQEQGTLTLYGESGLKKIGTDEDDVHSNPLYEAKVSLTPRIARLEVKTFSCDFTDAGAYSKFGLLHLAFNNYYTKASLFEGKVGDGLVKIDINEKDVFNYFANLTEGWNNDEVNITLEKPADGAIATEDANFAYHFFPVAGEVANAETDGYPQLILKADGSYPTTASDQADALFLATRVFNEGQTAIDKFEAGHIYRVNFAFKNSDFKQPDKCVEVTVEVATWKVVEVTPGYN